MEVGKLQAKEIEEEDILEEVGYEEDFVDEDDVEKLIDQELRNHEPNKKSMVHSGSSGKVITQNKFSSSQAMVMPESPPTNQPKEKLPSRRATVLRKDRQVAKQNEEIEDEILD